MVRVTFIFKLVYMDTIYIIFININSVIDFNNLINNYFRYHYINIYIQKKDIFQNLINF